MGNCCAVYGGGVQTLDYMTCPCLGSLHVLYLCVPSAQQRARPNHTAYRDEFPILYVTLFLRLCNEFTSWTDVRLALDIVDLGDGAISSLDPFATLTLTLTPSFASTLFHRPDLRWYT